MAICVERPMSESLRQRRASSEMVWIALRMGLTRSGSCRRRKPSVRLEGGGGERSNLELSACDARDESLGIARHLSVGEEEPNRLKAMQSLESSRLALDRLREPDRSSVRRNRVVDSTGSTVVDLLRRERPGVDDLRLLGGDGSTAVVESCGDGELREGEVRVGVEEGGGDADGEGC